MLWETFLGILGTEVPQGKPFWGWFSESLTDGSWLATLLSLLKIPLFTSLHPPGDVKRVQSFSGLKTGTRGT